jgi:hypothetical protein
MANILGIFTAIILAVSAFIAVKNNARFETEIANKETESQRLATSQGILKDRQKTLEELPIERADIDAQFAVKSEEEAKLKEANNGFKADIQSKTSKIAANKTQFDEFREKTPGIGNIRDLADKMKSMRVEREELTTAITNNEATLANLSTDNTNTQAEADRRKLELDTLGKGQSLPSLKTSIRNIYPAWGFVTLAAGNDAGVNANSTLDIVRDGETIARLLVTAVETRSASASIIPDSIAQDVTLMVGDRVVASTKNDKPNAESN